MTLTVCPLSSRGPRSVDEFTATVQPAGWIVLSGELDISAVSMSCAPHSIRRCSGRETGSASTHAPCRSSTRPSCPSCCGTSSSRVHQRWLCREEASNSVEVIVDMLDLGPILLECEEAPGGPSGRDGPDWGEQNPIVVETLQDRFD